MQSKITYDKIECLDYLKEFNIKSADSISLNINDKVDIKEIIKQAVKEGIGEDWGYDGEDEYPYDTFDEDIATESVINALNKHLL